MDEPALSESGPTDDAYFVNQHPKRRSQISSKHFFFRRYRTIRFWCDANRERFSWACHAQSSLEVLVYRLGIILK